MFKKQLAAVNVLLSITFAISLFNEGLALKCYDCMGLQDDGYKCWAKPKEFELKECGANVTTPAKTQVPKCIKIVLTQIDNVEAVLRTCASGPINYCELFKKGEFFQEVVCEECTEDGCNSSSTLTLGFITFLVPISIVMLLAH